MTPTSTATGFDAFHQPARVTLGVRVVPTTLALALLGVCASCGDELGGRMGDDELAEPMLDGRFDLPGQVTGTCLQSLADGYALEQVGCSAQRVIADFPDSPLGQVAVLSRAEPLVIDGGTHLDLLLCDAGVGAGERPLWGPLTALAEAYDEHRDDAYGDPGAGCQWVPAEDFVGIAFLYLHNTYEPTPLTQEAAWRLFHHYPDTLAYLFAVDPNFSFSFVNRHLQYYLESHATDYEWTRDLVDTYVVGTWGSDFADIVITNNASNMMPTTPVTSELVGEFTPPLPNRIAQHTLQAMNDAWNGADKLVVRLGAIIALSELGVPFTFAPQFTPPSFRPLVRMQGGPVGKPLSGVVERDVLTGEGGLNVALLDDDVYRQMWVRQADPVSGSVATVTDFDFFYETLIADGRVHPDVTWQKDVLPFDKEGRPVFHLEFVLGTSPAEIGALQVRDELFTNGRAVGTLAQTAPNASRGVLFEEMFHTSQPVPANFRDPLNYQLEIEFRDYALENASRLGFDTNLDQLAIWEHERASYRMLLEMADNGIG